MARFENQVCKKVIIQVIIINSKIRAILKRGIELAESDNKYDLTHGH